MGNINLAFGNKKQKSTNKFGKEKVILTYHDGIPGKKEYYTYIDTEGNEQKFEDTTYTISKLSSTKYIAKKVSVSKVNLDFIPSKESVDYKPGYFTYNDNELYLNKPIYDKDSNSYFGINNIVKIYDKEIKLYEEI